MGISKLNWWMWLRRELFVLTPFWMATLNVVLQVIDWATTLFLVQRFDASAEMNPFLRFLLENPNGFWWFTGVKLLGCTLLAFVIPWSIRNTKKPWIWRWLAILYIAIVTNNLLGVATVYMMSI